MDPRWTCPVCHYALDVYQARCPRCGTPLSEAWGESCDRCRLSASCGPANRPASPRGRPHRLLWGAKG